MARKMNMMMDSCILHIVLMDKVSVVSMCRLGWGQGSWVPLVSTTLTAVTGSREPGWLGSGRGAQLVNRNRRKWMCKNKEERQCDQHAPLLWVVINIYSMQSHLRITKVGKSTKLHVVENVNMEICVSNQSQLRQIKRKFHREQGTLYLYLMLLPKSRKTLFEVLMERKKHFYNLLNSNIW